MHSNPETKYFYKLMYEAIETQNVNVCEFLLDHISKKINLDISANNTLTSVAMEKGNLPIYKLLVKTLYLSFNLWEYDKEINEPHGFEFVRLYFKYVWPQTYIMIYTCHSLYCLGRQCPSIKSYIKEQLSPYIIKRFGTQHNTLGCLMYYGKDDDEFVKWVIPQVTITVNHFAHFTNSEYFSKFEELFPDFIENYVIGTVYEQLKADPITNKNFLDKWGDLLNVV
jgi:hypothetical protein